MRQPAGIPPNDGSTSLFLLGRLHPKNATGWLIRGSGCIQNPRDVARRFLKFLAYQGRHGKGNAGAS